MLTMTVTDPVVRSGPAPRVTALTLAMFALACTGCGSLTSRRGPARAASPPAASVPAGAVDPEATNFPYPYPVHFLALHSQSQALRMAYLDVASSTPNGRNVLLLHGKNFSAAAWASTIAALTEQGFRVIAPDQIGFGKSSKPRNYQFSFALLAHHTHALLASLGVEHAVVVGHSMGGMLATRYALAYPQATEKLVLVNPIGLEDYSALVPYRTVDEWYADELKQTADSIRDYQRKSYYDGAWQPAYEALIQLQVGWTQHPEYPRVAWNSAQLYDMIFTQPVVHDFARVRVPTRLIIGTRDKTALGRPFAPPEIAAGMGNYEQLGKRTRDAIPGAQLVELPGVGHIPQVEAFEAYRNALLEFLK
jgi:pimeloyl-ACP methyl ester carboxylesterase